MQRITRKFTDVPYKAGMEIQFGSTTSLHYIFNKHTEVLAVTNTGGTQVTSLGEFLYHAYEQHCSNIALVFGFDPSMQKFIKYI